MAKTEHLLQHNNIKHSQAEQRIKDQPVEHCNRPDKQSAAVTVTSRHEAKPHEPDVTAVDRAFLASWAHVMTVTCSVPSSKRVDKRSMPCGLSL